MNPGTISIIGAGIGGLTLALSLRRHNLPFQLFEAASELRPVGAGIVLSPNALYVYDQLGLLQELEEIGVPLGQFSLKTQKNENLQSNPTHFEVRGKIYRSLGMHRATLQEVLMRHLDPSHLHLGKRLQSLEVDRSTLHFSDGDTLQADGIVGADGLHSQVRKSLFPESAYRYSGQTCWRGVCDLQLSTEELADAGEMWGRGLRFGYVPIGAEKVYWYATQVTPQGQTDPSAETAKRTLLELFQHFHPLVTRLLSATSPHQLMRHDLIDIKALPEWHKHKTALLGDAAHAMTPNLGQGAAQSIEDAWALLQALLQESSLQQAFKTYSARRMPKAKRVAKVSWQVGQITNLQNPLVCYLRNSLLKLTPSFLTSKQTERLFQVA